MQNSKFIRATLFSFSMVAIGIGSALLFFPVVFESLAGIHLDQNSSLLSEIRAYGGLIFSGGIMISLGAFINNLLRLSFAVSSLLYLSIGSSRLISMFLDGIPAPSLLSATIAEITIGLISLFLFSRLNSPKQMAL